MSTSASTPTSASGVDIAPRTVRPGSAVFVAAAFGLSMAYTVVATLRGTAPPDFDATTPSVWIGYVLAAGTVMLALRDSARARRTVTVVLAVFLVAAVLVYPSYFTAPYQDTLGWFENDAYVGLLAVALYVNLRR
jgi:hypothetical protein